MYLVLSNDDFRRKSFCKNSSRLLINSLRMLLYSEHSHKIYRAPHSQPGSHVPSSTKFVSVVHSIAVPSFLILLLTGNCIAPLETLSSMNCVLQSQILSIPYQSGPFFLYFYILLASCITRLFT